MAFHRRRQGPRSRNAPASSGWLPVPHGGTYPGVGGSLRVGSGLLMEEHIMRAGHDARSKRCSIELGP